MVSQLMPNPSDGTVTAVNAGTRFLLEIAALVALGYWGYQTGEGPLLQFGLGIGIPLVVAVVCGLVGTPAAPYRLGQAWRILVELAILGGAVAALYLTGRTLLAVGFGIVVALDTTLLYVWERASFSYSRYTKRSRSRSTR